MVFSCKFYHYLLMGAPDFMMFHNLKDEKVKEIPVPIDLTEPDEDGVVRITLKVRGQSETKETTHSLYIESSPMDWEYQENDRATVKIDNKLNVKVSIPKGDTTETSGHETNISQCSGFTIRAKAQEGAREYFDIDGSWTCYADIKGLKLTRTYKSYNKDKLSYSRKLEYIFNGQAEISCTNSHGELEFYIKLPEYTGIAHEKEYYTSQYGPKEESRTTSNKGFGLSWTINNSQ